MPGMDAPKISAMDEAKRLIKELLDPPTLPADDGPSTSTSNAATYKDRVKQRKRELHQKIEEMTEEKADMAERVVKNLPLIVVGADLLGEALEKGDEMDAEDRNRAMAIAYMALLAVQGLRPHDDEAEAK